MQKIISDFNTPNKPQLELTDIALIQKGNAYYAYTMQEIKDLVGGSSSNQNKINLLAGKVPICTGFTGLNAGNLGNCVDGNPNTITTEAITGGAWNAGYFGFDLGKDEFGILQIDGNARSDRSNQVLIRFDIYWSSDNVDFQYRAYELYRSVNSTKLLISDVIHGRYIRLYGIDTGQGQCRIALRDVSFYAL